MIELKISGETLTKTECQALIAFAQVMGGIPANTSTHTMELKIDTTKAIATLEELNAHPAIRTMGEGDPLDLPDAGTLPIPPAPVAVIPAAPAPAAPIFAAFQQQAAALPNVAPFTAAVDPSLTAPAASPGISAPNPNAMIPSAPLAPLAGAQPAALGTGAPVDSEGLPWDARIHASTRSTISSGTWKLARGVDKALVESVKAELRTIMALPKPAAGATGAVASIPAAPNSAPMAAFPFPPPNAGQPSATSQTTDMSQASAPGTFPAAPVAGGAVDFAWLMEKIIPLVSTAKITQAQIVEACIECGFASLPLVAARPDMIPQVAAAIDRRVAP